MDFSKDIEQYRSTHPQKSRKINGIGFIYTLSGRGDKTLVLLTGGAGISEAFFKHVIVLEQKYRILIFDYPLAYLDNNSLADGIAQLIKQENLQNVYLVGQSYGGLLAQSIAKMHPEIVSGLILSNTATIVKDMPQDAKVAIEKMQASFHKTIKLMKILPFALVRPMMIKRVVSKVKSGDVADATYVKEFFTFLFKQLNNKKEIHMCCLMLDFISTQCFSKEDFAYLDGKVLLILAADDDTFGKDAPKLLAGVMTNPIVSTSMTGGHLALMLKFDAYIKLIEEFVA